MRLLYFFGITLFIAASLVAGSCAQIGFPSGGLRDSLPPVLTKATPAHLTKNVRNNRFVFEFDEYIDVQEIANNLFISPAQTKIPAVIVNTRSISLRFRDSLLPNTTYNINFGSAIRDINENNVLRNFSYTFSTGNVIDSLNIRGNVILAETGTYDSTMLALLYRDATDSSVRKRRPDYLARVDRDGNFQFTNLPAGSFSLYALKDKDGGKTYNNKAELFAFSEKTVSAAQDPAPVQLVAYAEEPEITQLPVLAPGKRLSYTTNLQGDHNYFKPIVISFNNRIVAFDSAKIRLTDTSFRAVAATAAVLDSTQRNLSIRVPEAAAQEYRLLIEKSAVRDSAGNELTRDDTLRFRTKRTEDYGRLTLRFNNLDIKAKPVLQFFGGASIVASYPLTGPVFTNNYFLPGEFSIRILYDTNGDGKWTPGDLILRRQPETVIALPQKLSVRADWDNEREVVL